METGQLYNTPEVKADGQIATQIALSHPKCQVTAIAGSEDKLAELRKMGVHHALNYKDKDFAKQLRKTGHVDVYFDNGMYSIRPPHGRSRGYDCRC
jgi:NADPH-dependent curcumin reductase CurA